MIRALDLRLILNTKSGPPFFRSSAYEVVPLFIFSQPSNFKLGARNPGASLMRFELQSLDPALKEAKLNLVLHQPQQRQQQLPIAFPKYIKTHGNDLNYFLFDRHRQHGRQSHPQCDSSSYQFPRAEPSSIVNVSMSRPQTSKPTSLFAG